MTRQPIDPRLIAIDEVEYDEPVQRAEDQLAVIMDNLVSGYLRSPGRTDAMLRRDGMVKTADRLVELLGPKWWDGLAE